MKSGRSVKLSPSPAAGVVEWSLKFVAAARACTEAADLAVWRRKGEGWMDCCSGGRLICEGCRQSKVWNGQGLRRRRRWGNASVGSVVANPD